MKKALILAIYSLLCALFFIAFPPAGKATVMGVYPGDLIKLQNDNDPSTHEDEVVYYFDKEWYRHPFPNRKVYLSWYKDWSGIKELTREQLAEIRLGGNIVYRPGTRLVKIPSVPKVYAVEPRGALRWIESEAVAVALFGTDWAKRVDDVPESFFVNYAEGAPLVSPYWPTGTVVRRNSDSTLFFIDGPHKRHLTATAAESYRLADEFVIGAAGDLSGYVDGADVNPAELRYVDTAQIDHVETLPPPQFDLVDAGQVQVSPGQARRLLTIRVTAGQSVIIKKLGVTLSGQLWSGASPKLTNLRFATVGENLFGTRQLESSVSASELVEWNGAYTMPANTTAYIDLLADVAAQAAGTKFTATVESDRVGVADGGNSQALPDYYPRTDFSPVAVEVK